jgi:EmrB/QacA subfamily drug resistance transporter
MAPLIVATAFFMENLDGTVITTALPQIAESFNIGVVNASSGITSYLITLAIFIPISGWMADRFGTRTVLAWAIGIFTIASLLCALSTGIEQFVVARILQGIGGAMMVPVGRLIVLRTTPKEKLAKTIALITWPGLVAPIIGPPLGGFLTTYFSWQWVFILNIPLGLLGIILVYRYIENEFASDCRRLDWLGFVFTGLMLANAIIALEEIGKHGLSLEIAYYSMAAALFCWLLVRHTKRHESPILNFAALKIPSFAVTVMSGSAARILIGVTPFLAPLMFQIGFGYNPFVSGLLLLAAMLGNLGLKPLTPLLLKLFGFRNILLVNTGLSAISAILCGLLVPTSDVILICAVMLIYGTSRSMQFTCLQTLAFVDIPPEKMSRANTLFSTITQLSQGMGVSVAAVLLQFCMLFHGTSNPTPSVADFQITFMIVGGLLLTLLPNFKKLDPNIGSLVSGHRQN